MSVSLKKNISYGLVGNVIYAFTQWGMLSIFNKIGTPEITGKYALALSISAPLMILGQMGLRQTLATDANEKHSFQHYYFARFCTSFISFILAILISIFFYSSDVVFVTIAVSVAKIIDNLSDITYGFNQKKEQIKKIAISKIARGFFGLAIVAIVFYYTKNLMLTILAQAAVWGIIYIINDHISFEKVNFRIIDIYQVIRISYPLAITSLLVSLNTNIPRYFIEKILGIYDLGVFVSLTYLITAGALVIQAIGQTISPRLAKYYCKKDLESFKKLTFKSIGLVFIICAVGALGSSLFGKYLLSFIYGSEFSKNIELFLLIILFGTVLYITTILGYALTAARVLQPQPFIFTVCIIASLISNFFLVENYALYGATASWGISITIGLVFNFTFLYRALNK